MKGFLRFLAGVFLMVAVIAAVNDVTRSQLADRTVVISAHEHWTRLAPVTLAAARRSVERGLHPLVWDWGLAPLLQLPAWGLFALFALACGYAGRRRRQVNVFAN